jgi:hypothetical protein
MRKKTKMRLLSILLCFVMLVGLMPTTVFAQSGAGTEQDPLYVSTFAELKAALEKDEDTWIVVNEFNNGNYYTLISGNDYVQTSLDASAYECGAINIPTGKNKHLTINATIDCRTASTQSGSLLYCFINNRGNLTIDGTGTLAVSFNAGNYANSIIFNQGELYIDAPVTLDATCKTLQTYGRAITNYIGTFTIKDGTYIGFKSKYLGTSGSVGAIWNANNDANDKSVISGGRFECTNEDQNLSVNYALVCNGVANLTLKGGTFYGIYASQYNIELNDLLGSNCKYIQNGSDYVATGVETNDTLTVVNTNLIQTVNVTVTLPVNGSQPATATPTVSTSNTSIYAYEWYKGDNQLSNYLDTFSGGETYRLQMRVNTTKEFSKDTVVMVNGQQATVKSFDEDYILFYCDFVAKNQEINTVQVGLDTPLAGGEITAPYAYTDTVTLTTHEWYPNVTYYEAGHSFKLTFRITPKDGYEFSDSLKVILNGKQTTITWKDTDFAVCEYTFDIPEEEPELVSAIAITVDKPVAGGTPAEPSISSNQYTLGIHEWTPSTFVAGNTAKLTLLVYPSAGYKFVDEATTATVNGESATISVGQNYARIEYTFDVVNMIDNVTLSMTAPVAGETASTTVDDNSNLYTTTMYWTSGIDNGSNGFSGQFVQGTKYYATFMINTNSPNEFADGTSVYINGTKYTATWVSQGYAKAIQVANVEFDTPAQAPQEYLVSYYPGEGSGTGETDYYADGTEFTLKSPELVGLVAPAGKVFDYWQIGNPETARKNAGETITITQETYIYAIWKDAPVTEVIYYYYPGEASGNADWDIVDIETQIILKDCMFTAPDGKQFKAWAIGSVNGEQKQPGEQITITGETYIYAIWESIAVSNYIITATAGENGNITPSGEVSVAKGSSKTFTITADSGYHIKDVKLNGTSIGVVSVYTFENVSDNATISVEFDVDTVLHTCNPNPVPKVEPNCTTAGKSAYYHCECGKNYEDAHGNTEIADIETWGILNPLDHDYASAWSSDASGHWKICARCSEKQNASSHIVGDWIVDKEATETVPGSKHKECSVCGYKLETAEIPKTGKQEEATPVPAAKGKVITDEQGSSYKVTKSDAKDGEVTFTKPKSGASGTVKIPDTVTIDGITYKVTAIEANAFKNNKKNITKVIIGNNVKVIGKNAFAGCKKLNSVTVGKNVKTISAGAFSGCAKLKTVKLGAAVTTIGDKAFYKCTSLTSITIPAKVTKIGKSAFEGCKKLKTITVKSTKLKSVGKKALKGIHTKAKIKVPKSKLAKYKSLFKNKGQGKNVKVTK